LRADESADLPPPRLYKYRALGGDNFERLESIFINNYLWSGSPLEFNDPFDCFPAIDTTGSAQEILAWTRRNVDRNFKGVSRQQRRANARNLANSIGKDGGLGGGGSNDGGHEAWKQTLAKMGVVSLTAKPDDLLMWGHYADSHRGVCLEFDSSLLPFNLARRVQYVEERPIFRPFDADRSDLMERTLLR
jgi:Protein of unknown function (DUF2971)